MKNLFSVLSIITFLLLVGCASPDKRIGQNQVLFDSYSVETKSLIREGRVVVGFDREQVEMALGKPDRTATIQTDSGAETLWRYFKRSPSVGLALGAGTVLGGGNSSVGTGIGIGTDSNRLEIEKVVVFDQASGKVKQIESYE